MSSEEHEIPGQPPFERVKMRALGLLAALLSLSVALGNAPYDLKKQSTIMVKSESALNIWSTRDTFHHWPKDEFDKGFAFGVWAKAEEARPRFQFLGVRPDKKNPNKEIATYDFVLRGEHGAIEIGYDPADRKH